MTGAVAQLLQLTMHVDERGTLVAGEMGEHLPFIPVRFFTISGVPRALTRGGHAHRTCHQLLVVLEGSVSCYWEDSEGTCTSILSADSYALYLPPLVWARQTYLSEESLLLVLASHSYDADDYIDDASIAGDLRMLYANSSVDSGRSVEGKP